MWKTVAETPALNWTYPPLPPHRVKGQGGVDKMAMSVIWTGMVVLAVGYGLLAGNGAAVAAAAVEGGDAAGGDGGRQRLAADPRRCAGRPRSRDEPRRGRPCW